MKTIATFDTKAEGWTELSRTGFELLVEHAQGLVFTNHGTFEYRLLRRWKNQWEIQEPEIGDE
jgi:hypothetical protein